MRTQSADTSVEAEKVQIDLLRKASPEKRLSLMCSLSETVRFLSKQAIQQKHPEWDQREVNIAFVEYHYGKELAENLRRYLETKGQ